MLARWRDSALRAAAANVVVGERMADTVRRRGGIAAERTHVIPNWCDDEGIVPVAEDLNPLRREWGLAGRFVVGYSGNLGRAHDFATVLAAAEYLRNDDRFVFLCVGGGHKFDELARAVEVRRLGGAFRFMAYQEQAQLRYSLSVPDLHWISLSPEFEGLIFPSKLYGIAAAGRPMIAIAAPDGEIARLVRDNECGFVVAPGAGEELAATLRRAIDDREGLGAMGRRARALLDARFTRSHALEKWRTVLASVG
jgi:glycosyltransferase involved in cell wall biosynthesis